MNAPDANLLLFAYHRASPFHTAARAYLEAAISSGEPYGLPILSVHAFVRISTSRIWGEHRLSMAHALGIVDSLLQRPHVRLLHPGPLHWRVLSELIRDRTLSSGQFSDAAIAAIAIEHGAIVHTHDIDFARWLGFAASNPLTM